MAQADGVYITVSSGDIMVCVEDDAHGHILHSRDTKIQVHLEGLRALPSNKQSIEQRPLQ